MLLIMLITNCMSGIVSQQTKGFGKLHTCSSRHKSRVVAAAAHNTWRQADTYTAYDNLFTSCSCISITLALAVVLTTLAF